MKLKLIAVSAAILLSLTAAGFGYSSSLQATDESVQAAVSNAATASFDIQNMTCVACPITVRKAMSRVKGVNQVEIDFQNKTAQVIFNPAITTAELIGEASTSIGYPATLAGGE
tara:strand:+ start:27686 stop:28027 length:342 start_codon:yes stop_codon:yes gene_type:complete